MMEWIQRTRLKSDSTKNKIAIILAAGITILIVGLWFLLIRNKKTDETARADSTRDDLRPLFMIFKGAKEDFKDIQTDIRKQKAEMKEVKNESNNVTQ